MDDLLSHFGEQAAGFNTGLTEPPTAPTTRYGSVSPSRATSARPEDAWWRKKMLARRHRHVDGGGTDRVRSR